MDDSEIFRAFFSLYDDISEAEQFDVEKPLLAHYTSLDTLENILKTNEVWFSNPLFMNDLEEVKFGVSQGVDIVLRSKEISDACGATPRARIFNRYFDQYFKTFENEQAFDTYVFCLSEHDKDDHDGMLSMWRGYGASGNGAAVIFDTGRLEVIEGSPLIVGKVHYGSGEERIASFKDILSKFVEIFSETEIPDDKLYLPAYRLFERIKVFALFSKHHGFKEEREWRVVYMREQDRDKKLDSMFDYTIGSRGIEPKLKFKVAPIASVTSDDLSLEKIIERIILGPSLSSPMAKTAVLRMLDRLGKSELKEKVHASMIPFRPTQSQR
uniref:DUF2971 domain-containing protein n=1 Tax=Candidatus Kentrum sp. FM TaxID=2126340 RepID=A0A450W4L0_9GAMM|nr:MAG: Protein of unknown function (DUF2971) [Candidatus Kentron sp. FM]VFJ65105.1 MAG: Protein of unknown function (DUF2971) [Candidatus Kentron sp. FM]VFK11972.1 MAG: Protein of unknown function (DUF2971) [Candidatus Kentron sp. FM]